MKNDTPHSLLPIVRATSLGLILLEGQAFCDLHAAVKPNPLFSDNAVLQRDRKILVWGTADEGRK